MSSSDVLRLYSSASSWRSRESSAGSARDEVGWGEEEEEEEEGEEGEGWSRSWRRRSLLASACFLRT